MPLGTRQDDGEGDRPRATVGHSTRRNGAEAVSDVVYTVIMLGTLAAFILILRGIQWLLDRASAPARTHPRQAGQPDR